MIPKISKTKKMPGPSWSVRAWERCPAKINLKTKEVDDACKTCYARFGNYRFKNVIAARVHNEKAWKTDTFVPNMVSIMDSYRYFRWFDSGDMYDVRLAEKIYDICKQTEWCKHWIPTRMFKLQKFDKVIEKLNALPNVVVRFSSHSIEGEQIEGQYTSTIIPFTDSPTDATICYAYDRDGKCGDCRACWSKDEKVIAYVGHGQVMKSVLKKKGLIK